jgi:hypothetical protein
VEKVKEKGTEKKPENVIFDVGNVRTSCPTIRLWYWVP